MNMLRPCKLKVFKVHNQDIPWTTTTCTCKCTSIIRQFHKGDHLVNSQELCDGVCIDVTRKNSILITLTG